MRICFFIRLMTFFPEYRTVFCVRTGLPGKLLSIFCRRMPTLAIQANQVGGGLVINHGHGTFVTATEIGENCLLDQMVTIGYNTESVPPTIGNNVTIHVGATIVGNVHVGDNSIVGANSLVISDVPPDVTVLGVPAKIIVARKHVLTQRRGKTHPKNTNDAP
jgi:serine O-acetyltransferase